MKQFCQELFGMEQQQQQGETSSSIEQEAAPAETKNSIEQETASLQQQEQDENVHEDNPSVNGDKKVVVVQEERTNPEATFHSVQEQEVKPATSLEQEENDCDKTLNVDNTNEQEGASSPREDEHDREEPATNENPLLALAEEAEEHSHHWSASTVSMHSPVKKHSPMETDESEEEEYGEMTQGTSNAVAALTVLASGGRGK